MLHESNVRTRPTLTLQPFELRDVLNLAFGSVRVDGFALGWITRTCFEEMHKQGRMLSCWNNNDAVGYVVWFRSRQSIRIALTWIRRDARLVLHGRALVDHVNHVGAFYRHTTMALFCAEDLPANLFWRACGFTDHGWRWGRAKKSRRHIHWRRPITPTYSPPLGPSIEPQDAPAPPNRSKLLLP